MIWHNGLRTQAARDGAIRYLDGIVAARQQPATMMKRRRNPRRILSPEKLDEIVPMQAFLERAKGFEPSTPTLARSCSTTELHPHPKALAAKSPATRRPMPKAAAECNRAATPFVTSRDMIFPVQAAEPGQNRPAGVRTGNRLKFPGGPPLKAQQTVY
jgi:hypothetical protein